VAKTPSGAPALSVVLGGAGGADLDGFAQRNRGERLAIVVDGEIVSAPVVNFTSFAGRVQVTGLSEERTQNLFRRLNDVIKAGD
jgi:preprotein translocase subunit SecD